jgi:hypothetical protein
MSDQWFYYHNNKQEGPMTLEQLKNLVVTGQLNHTSYVWTKGFADWKLIKDVSELNNTEIKKQQAKVETTATATQEFTQAAQEKEPAVKLFLGSVKNNEKCIYIKTGFDRGGTPKEYGPFDIDMLKKLYQTNRINGRTLVYFPGIDCWRILAVFVDFEDIFNELPPIIEESDRRRWERKPFTAKLFFTTDNQFYEGVCKDISLGGMQVLLYKFPGKVGEVIKLNVHPEDPNHQFVAKAKIVRIAKTDGALSMEFLELSDVAKKAIETYLS